MIFLKKKEWDIINAILKKYPYSFYLFRSRAKGTQRPLSDIDLGYRDIPSRTIAIIEGEFEESDLPFKVDLVDLNHCSPEFLQHIQKDLILLKENALINHE